MKEAIHTQLTDIGPNRILIRGYPVVDLLEKYSVGDLIYLLNSGELPKGNQGRMLEAILVCCADHGINAPSTQVARSVASCGSPLQTAMAAGISALGDYHGGAGESLAKAMQEVLPTNPELDSAAEQVVNFFIQSGQRVPGYGHRVHKPDPRAVRLLEMAERLGISGGYVALAKKIEERLESQSGRALPMNVDGALAALISDMNMDWRYARAIFIIARAIGLAAQVIEEQTTGKPMQFPTPQPVLYTGEKERRLPDGDADAP